MTQRPEHSAEADDPRRAARDWLAHLRDENGAGSSEPVLWYYRRRWYEWSGARWRHVEQGYLSLRLARFLQEREAGGPVSRPLLEQVMLNLQAETLLENWDTPPPFEVVGRNPLTLRPKRLLLFDNGVLTVNANGSTPFREAAGSRYFTPASVPFSYDSQAACPRWRQFLDEVLPKQDPEDQRQHVLQEAVLASLLGERQHYPLVLLAGTARGANGKSTFLAVWRALLDPDSVSHLGLEALGRTEAISALEGPRVNFADELPEPHRLPRQRLLQLLRGEPFELLQRQGPVHRVEPTAVWAAVCAQLPELTPADRRWWRRVQVVPFEHTLRPGDVEPRLAQTVIRRELPGVINWALEAAPRLARGKLTRCARCRAVAEEHVHQSDPVEQFLEDCCHLNWSEAQDLRDAIYRAYTAYCRIRLGPGARPLSRAQFGQRLRQYGVGDTRKALPDGRRPRYYTHIALGEDGLKLLREVGYLHDDEPEDVEPR